MPRPTASCGSTPGARPTRRRPGLGARRRLRRRRPRHARGRLGRARPDRARDHGRLGRLPAGGRRMPLPGAVRRRAGRVVVDPRRTPLACASTRAPRDRRRQRRREPRDGRRAAPARRRGPRPASGRERAATLRRPRVVLAYPTLHAVQPATPPRCAPRSTPSPDADRFGPDSVRGDVRELRRPPAAPRRRGTPARRARPGHGIRSRRLPADAHDQRRRRRAARLGRGLRRDARRGGRRRRGAHRARHRSTAT